GQFSGLSASDANFWGFSEVLTNHWRQLQAYDRNESGIFATVNVETDYTYATSRWDPNKPGGPGPDFNDGSGNLYFSKVGTVSNPSGVGSGTSVHVTANDYDPLTGTLNSVSQTLWSVLNGSQAPLVTRYKYDGHGLLIKETDPRGDQSQTTYTTTYQDFNQ